MKKTLELLEKLVGFDTTNPPGNESAAAEYLYEYLSGSCDKIEFLGDEPRKNIIAYFGRLDSKNVLVFNGHIDVVPAKVSEWDTNPFTLTRKEDRCYGRGTADMKGGIVAAVRAIEEAKQNGYLNDKLVIFAGSVDEETGADSRIGCRKVMEHLMGSGIKVEGVIIPEPNPDQESVQVNLGHRGLIWIECIARGKVGHSGLLQVEDNAIVKMNRFIEELYGYFGQRPMVIDGIPQSSCKITYISAGSPSSFNIIPEVCSSYLDVRVSPKESNEQVLSQISSIAEKHGICLKMVKNTPSASISRNDRIMHVTEKVLNGMNVPYEVSYATPTCDAHWFINNGMPAINGMGPNGENVHGHNEWASLESLMQRIELFRNIIKEF